MSVFKRKTRDGKKAKNYTFEFRDETGKLRTRSAGTSDRRLATQLWNQEVDRVRAIKAGLVSPADERFRDESRKPLAEHVEYYVRACIDRGDDMEAIRGKERALKWFLGVVGDSFDGIQADVFDARLGGLKKEGKSARTQNLRLAQARAFLNWAVRNGRTRSNPLVVVSRRNELADRRLIRRELSAEETTALIDAARGQARKFKTAQGRAAWYLLPLLAGARRSDMVKLHWTALDLDARQPTWTIRDQKAKRVNVLPLCPELVEELGALRFRQRPHTAPVFPRIVSNATRVRDFERAGIVYDKPEGKADLHALRHTFGTRLARAGCTPVRLQKLMRHARIETTMKYYVHLSVDDLAEGVNLLARVEGAS